MITPEIRKAINICIAKNVPFIAYALPGVDYFVFFSNPSSDNGRLEESVSISFFGKDNTDLVTVKKELDEYQTILLMSDKSVMESPEISPWLLGTSYMQYCAQVHCIVNGLKKHGGKVVLSRVLCGSVGVIDWADVASEYFGAYPATFRYIYYTVETGCWMGASPELLLEHLFVDEKFSTMALAGTRSVDECENEWDAKNVEEHDYVTGYIVKTLGSLGIKTVVSAAENLKYGTIEHLCHRIEASCPPDGVSYEDVMRQLSPTPALAGFPVERAIRDIAEYEVHPRHCYGGFVSVRDSDGIHAYVNLRCVHFDLHSYCVYAGGGLTSMSVDSVEWAETESKVSVLKKILDINNSISQSTIQ